MTKLRLIFSLLSALPAAAGAITLALGTACLYDGETENSLRHGILFLLLSLAAGWIFTVLNGSSRRARLVLLILWETILGAEWLAAGFFMLRLGADVRIAIVHGAVFAVMLLLGAGIGKLRKKPAAADSASARRD